MESIIGNQLINRPEGGTYQRPIPSMLAIVVSDSIPLLPPVFYNRKIDTEDSECNIVGNWLTSSLTGYWGGSPSIYANTGVGDQIVEYNLELPYSGYYELFGWWTSASNRAVNTPYVIVRGGMADTIEMNQSTNGSKWNKIGNFYFDISKTNKLKISNYAEVGKVVVADGIRIVSYDSVATRIKSEPPTSLVEKFSLFQNHPNPFNPTTIISYQLPEEGRIKLELFNILGEKLATLEEDIKPPGKYEFLLNSTIFNLAAGIYICRLIAGEHTQSIKLNFLK